MEDILELLGLINKSVEKAKKIADKLKKVNSNNPNFTTALKDIENNLSNAEENIKYIRNALNNEP